MTLLLWCPFVAVSQPMFTARSNYQKVFIQAFFSSFRASWAYSLMIVCFSPINPIAMTKLARITFESLWVSRNLSAWRGVARYAVVLGSLFEPWFVYRPQHTRRSWSAWKASTSFNSQTNSPLVAFANVLWKHEISSLWRAVVERYYCLKV